MDTSAMLKPLASEPPWFAALLRKLLIADLSFQLPGKPADIASMITDDEARRLLGRASVLSLSDKASEQAIAYEVATRLLELFEDRIPGVVSVADVVLSRIGNFPGRTLLRSRYAGGEQVVPDAPARLRLECIGREVENTVEVAGQVHRPLTDFQLEFFEALDSSESVSVSAPTSAGKSFILGLDLIRRLRKKLPACIVYVVPTRALIREVTVDIRKKLRDTGLGTVPVRSVPFPISAEKAPQGAVFVLTQERLLSLLHSREGFQWITTLVVDEAQGIRDNARGVILQTAIEAVLIKHPNVEIHFASPLASNPDFLLDVIHRRETGKHFVRVLSPVSQNLIAVSEVDRKPEKARFRLLRGDAPLDLGVRDLDFKLRGSPYKQRALLARAVTRENESTLLYANLPADTEKLAAALVEGRDPPRSLAPEIRELIDFIRTDIHPEYPLIQCLPHGVAYHYGYMPAIIRARVEDLCRDGLLKFVCCTSTLLQGVNLPARHIVIENPRRGRDEDMTRADFLNLAGRAGRLLREFHGNVWCIRPGEWGSKSYEGEQLTEIRSAMNEAMADGGTIVQKVIANQASGKMLDYGEAALGKVYCDFVRAERDLAGSEWRTESNAVVLAETARQVQAMRITLPTHVLDANRSVRPDRMQALYEYLQEQEDIERFLPLPPYAVGTNDRMEAIIQLVHDKLGGIQNNSYKYYKQLAAKWVYGKPLSQIVSQHIGYHRAVGSGESVSAMIRNLLQDLEQDIRFRLVKYYMAYGSVLELVLRERGDTAAADALEPFHIYLECGASNRIALNLMAIGLSRATALALEDRVGFPSDAQPEDCLARLATVDLGALKIPALCLREVNDLLGKVSG